MIFDMHMHIEEGTSLPWQMSAEDCIRAMDEAGVQRSAVMTLTDLPGLNPQGLELIASACERYADRLYGFVRLHPAYLETSKQLLKQAITDLGFKGLKLHPVSTLQHPGGAATIELIRLAGELGVPTLFHCGDEPLSTPLSIAQAAAACPDATIILGHMGGYFHVDEALDVAEEFPNIVLETSAMPYPDKIRTAVERIGAGRVVFGSDGPVSSPALEKQKVIISSLGDEAAGLVLGGNAETLLGVAA
ncbi:amidohydrolase family protein [Kribbella sp.]|uniref:amidohydrolase family protein n=1 Tax=Kribbella sp. TaxID=1871183 RepID=UPI002D250E43|nr:TatD family hydrolase [Kribbella sp.]HZX03872.1 TatD family hydrolase [Kribbella sp.]